MPQQSLLPDHPPMTRLEVAVHSYPHTKSPDEIKVIARVAVGHDDFKTVAHWTLRLSERDFLNTLVEDITSVYMYGETPKDVVRSGASVVKMARAHAATYDF